jgi:D-alanyl-lipoteichoic acid acyltransferase DltB (MBOAT superfamily)
MLIGGFWHGVGANFILWGAFHGIGLIINHSILDFYKNRKYKFASKKFIKFVLQILGFLITFIFINFTWIYFNSGSIEIANKFISGIFSSQVSENNLVQPRLLAVIIFVLLINFFGERFYKIVLHIMKKFPFVLQFIIILVVFYILIKLGPSEIPAFVYYNF